MSARIWMPLKKPESICKRNPRILPAPRTLLHELTCHRCVPPPTKKRAAAHQRFDQLGRFLEPQVEAKDFREVGYVHLSLAAGCVLRCEDNLSAFLVADSCQLR